jgi:hypothetical protein
MDEAKRERIQDWLMKAFVDLEAARIMVTGPKYLRGTAVYHCQQAAEKAVKGYLFFQDQQFDKTHDVELLVNVAAPLNAGFLQWLVAAKRLTPYSVIIVIPAVLLHRPNGSSIRHCGSPRISICSCFL